MYSNNIIATVFRNLEKLQKDQIRDKSIDKIRGMHSEADKPHLVTMANIEGKRSFLAFDTVVFYLSGKIILLSPKIP